MTLSPEVEVLSDAEVNLVRGGASKKAVMMATVNSGTGCGCSVTVNSGTGCNCQ
ncbi:MAG: hypothetical protein LBS01_09915 [Prevotellaceae bacterium]|nr:hypothetical protein [Prevotellaceae bacterium]